jgi:hypothetical protein
VYPYTTIFFFSAFLTRLSKNSVSQKEILSPVESAPLHQVSSIEPKINTLAIIQKLKQEITIRLWKLKKSISKKCYWENIHYGVMDNSHLLSKILAKATENYIWNKELS